MTSKLAHGGPNMAIHRPRWKLGSNNQTTKNAFLLGKTLVFGISAYMGDVISRNPKCRSKRLDFFTASFKLTQEGSNIG
jgi:hypothetical protein